MDILDNIDEFILEETKDRGVVIENNEYYDNVPDNMSVQPMSDDAWDYVSNLANMGELPEIKHGGKSTKKSKKKRKQSKLSRRANRKK